MEVVIFPEISSAKREFDRVAIGHGKFSPHLNPSSAFFFLLDGEGAVLEAKNWTAVSENKREDHFFVLVVSS
jgi:hypothetical protein